MATRGALATSPATSVVTHPASPFATSDHDGDHVHAALASACGPAHPRVSAWPTAPASGRPRSATTPARAPAPAASATPRNDVPARIATPTEPTRASTLPRSARTLA